MAMLNMLNNQMVYFVVYMCLFCHVHTFDLVTPFQAGEQIRHRQNSPWTQGCSNKMAVGMACLWECAAG